MASSEASSSGVSGFKRYKKVKCQPKYCKCGVQAVAMVSTTLQNPNALFWSCRWKHCGVKHCDFWEWFTTESLIYPTTNDEMAYEQNLKLNDDVVKIKKRLKLIEGRLKYILILLVCVFVTVFMRK